jgi:hypothetical protein
MDELNWKRWYKVVIGFLAAEIVLFYLFTMYFS